MGKVIKIKGADFSVNGFDIPKPFVPQFFQEVIDYYNENGNSNTIHVISYKNTAKYASYGLVGTNVFNALKGLTVVGFRAKFLMLDTTEHPTCTVYHNVNGVKTLYEVLHLQKTKEWQDVFLTTPKKILSETDTFCFFVRLKDDESNIDDIDQTSFEYYDTNAITADETRFLSSKIMSKIRYDNNAPNYSDIGQHINFIFPICVDLR